MKEGKNIQIGDTVKIVDSGKRHSTHIDAAIKMRLYGWRHNDERGVQGEIVQVVGAMTDDDVGRLLGVMPSNDRPPYIINLDGVEPFTPTPEIDWAAKVRECVERLEFGDAKDCPLCQALEVRNGRANSEMCARCPLQQLYNAGYSKPGVGCYELGGLKCKDVGVSTADRFFPCIMGMVFQDALKFIKSGGMKDKK